MLLYLFSLAILWTAFKTISHKNPVYGAIYLALTMVLLAGIFFLLSAPFLAGLQLIIYAGAVMVLFVMVLMLFDFKKENLPSFKASSWIWPVFLFGLCSGVISLMAFTSLPSNQPADFFSGKSIALKLFTKYVLIFEMIGLLILVVAMAVVVLSRLDKD